MEARKVNFRKQKLWLRWFWAWGGSLSFAACISLRAHWQLLLYAGVPAITGAKCSEKAPEAFWREALHSRGQWSRKHFTWVGKTKLWSWVHASLRSCRSYLDQRLTYIKISRYLSSALTVACFFGKKFYSLIRCNKFLKFIFAWPSQIEGNDFINCYFWSMS